jgi:SAM-dependent methyltransferase
VLGVEVDARMAASAEFPVEVSAFEAWEPAGRSFDAVVSAQAWHWIEPVAGAAKAAAVLRPGGRFAAFWNVENPPGELAEAFGAVYRRVAPDLPHFRTTALEAHQAFFAATEDGLRAFGEPQRWGCEWERSYTRDEWLDQLPTRSTHSRLAPETLEALLAGLGAVIGGGFTMPYLTVTVTARTRL